MSFFVWVPRAKADDISMDLKMSFSMGACRMDEGWEDLKILKLKMVNKRSRESLKIYIKIFFNFFVPAIRMCWSCLDRTLSWMQKKKVQRKSFYTSQIRILSLFFLRFLNLSKTSLITKLFLMKNDYFENQRREYEFFQGIGKKMCVLTKSTK